MPDDADLREARGQEGPAFLGVERSLTGRRWCLRPAAPEAIASLAQGLSLPEPLARVLAGRGIGIDDAPGFIAPTLAALLPDPDTLKDMTVAAERLAAAVVAGEPTAVLADYDVDGATSSAVLRRFLAAVGLPAGLYVPDRLKEGYGPNVAALLALKAAGMKLVIVVDCGTAAHQPLEAAQAAGLDVIVLDHHQAPPMLPPAVAVVNPNRLDEDGCHRNLAAVGVTFLLVVAVNRLLRQRGWYATGSEPDLRWLLDLVALGTVCDMVPLIGLNRALVRQGLKVMARRRNAGLAALADGAGLRRAPTAHDLGFAFGPRVNAGGRVGRADIGAHLLACDDPSAARTMVEALDRCNRDRQQIENQVLTAALAGLPLAGVDEGSPMVWAVGRGWHPGVVGIVATRLVDRFHRPAFVFTFVNGDAVGSARSLPGIDLGAAVNAAVAAGVLKKGGGHAMAAGLTVDGARLDELKVFLGERIGRWEARRQPVPILDLDGLLSLSGAVPHLASAMAEAAPFGVGNPEPRFALANVRLREWSMINDQHLRCTLIDDGEVRLPAFAFRCAGTDLGRGLRQAGDHPLHIAGRLSERQYQGRSRIQLIIDDAVAVGACR